MTDPIKRTVVYGRDLFTHLEEFFMRATGKSATQFATVETFSDVIQSSVNQIAPRFEEAFCWLNNEMRAFYKLRGLDAFNDAKQLGGMNLVLGGSSRFLLTQLNSVSTAVLYSDTVFIPDPILPWLEIDRNEEEFQHVNLLQAVHTLLQLKPLVDANLHYPPVVVFPSFEKLLDKNDTRTQENILQLITDVLSNYLGEAFASFEAVEDFSNHYSERFYEAFDRSQLFVAPGGSADEPLEKALERYKSVMTTQRSQDWLNEYTKLPAHRRLLNGFSERIAPIYHLLENSQEFCGHPLLCIEQQAHYFKLVSRTSSSRLERIGVLEHKTSALIEALGSRRLRWLGGLPINALVKLRLDNENQVFRLRLAAALEKLHESVLSDVNQVAAAVCHDIEMAIAEYEKELRSIQKKYNRIHGQTAVLAVAAVGAALMPALAPLLGNIAPFVLASKYIYDKIGELDAKHSWSQSLIGVLAVIQPKT